MRFLITNDDGYLSQGIRVLAEEAKRYGEVIIVAPETGQSGKSHAITVCEPLKHTLHEDYGLEGVEVWSVRGTPVDCIKLGIYKILDGRRPDFVLSGINHGGNYSSSVHYSGTLGAVREAALLGIRGIGFSYMDYDPKANMDSTREVVARLLPRLINFNWPTSTYMNVNIPSGKNMGMHVCRVGQGHWIEKPHNVTDPYEQTYSWLEGEFVDDDHEGTDTDYHWLKKGYTTISPCKLDVTDYDVISQFKSIDL
ncbi:MAG: 5'/3'-nucleotidase SurE [Bacteroidia bacterium]|nr:5'/3'-nucleotidase SurE [Bacteroidia bacterium]